MKSLLIITSASFLSALSASADIPQHLNYQGRVSVGGVNFTGTGNFKFALVDGGTSFGATATANADVDGVAVTFVGITGPGSGYTSPPQITFSGPGTGATAVATLDLGIVSSITVTNGGTGYTTAPTVTIAPPPQEIVYSTLWSNDGSSNVGEEPTASIPLPVQNGLFSASLGDTGLGMQPFYQPIFGQPLSLRVWFSDGVHGFQRLLPDQKIAPAPISLRAKLAETVPDGSITSLSLADGAVGSSQLANGAVGGAQLASGSVDFSKITGGTSQAIVESALGSNLAAVNSGVAVSLDPASSSLTAAGYVKIGSQSFSSESWVPQPLQFAETPVGLRFPFSVWTGSSLLVFGDQGNGAISTFRYDPGTATWSRLASYQAQSFLAPNPLSEARMVHTGTEVIFWGIGERSIGFGNEGYYRKGASYGAAYHIAQGTWREISSSSGPGERVDFNMVWTGSRVIVWGGITRIERTFGPGTVLKEPAEFGGIYNPTTDTWSYFSGGPVGRVGASATWAGVEMFVWGGCELDANLNYVPKNTGAAYNPATDTWRDMSVIGAPAARFSHSAVLSGQNIHIFGGSSSSAGASYNWFLNTWTPISTIGQPQGRYAPATADNGNGMVVWGGDTSSASPSVQLENSTNPVSTGATYNRTTNQWTALSSAAVPDARADAAVAWTGSSLMIFGGNNDAGWLSNGAVWSSAGNLWSAIPSGSLDPRKDAASVWTGSEFIYWGGVNAAGQIGTGGRYNPSTQLHQHLPPSGSPSDRLGHTAVWSGAEMIVWGGRHQVTGSYPASGARFRPSTHAWSPISGIGIPSPRKDHTAVWTGSEMIVWGGADGASGTNLLDSGGTYRPDDDSWAPISNTGAPPSARSGHTAIWTGTEMIVWGGMGSSGLLADGARYNPTTGVWTALPGAGAPAARYLHSAVWTGTEMIVWGGFERQGPSLVALNSGARYSVATHSWTALPLSNAPSARHAHSAVWSGTEMIIYGGSQSVAGASLADGGRFSVAQNSWQPITPSGAPSARQGHSAFWVNGGMMTLLGLGAGGSYPIDCFRYSPPSTVHYYVKLNP